MLSFVQWPSLFSGPDAMGPSSHQLQRFKTPAGLIGLAFAVRGDATARQPRTKLASKLDPIIRSMTPENAQDLSARQQTSETSAYDGKCSEQDKAFEIVQRAVELHRLHFRPESRNRATSYFSLSPDILVGQDASKNEVGRPFMLTRLSPGRFDMPQVCLFPWAAPQRGRSPPISGGEHMLLRRVVAQQSENGELK
jgi:hypothetical protein